MSSALLGDPGRSEALVPRSCGKMWDMGGHGKKSHILPQPGAETLDSRDQVRASLTLERQGGATPIRTQLVVHTGPQRQEDAVPCASLRTGPWAIAPELLTLAPACENRGSCSHGVSLAPGDTRGCRSWGAAGIGVGSTSAERPWSG